MTQVAVSSTRRGGRAVIALAAIYLLGFGCGGSVRLGGSDRPEASGGAAAVAPAGVGEVCANRAEGSRLFAGTSAQEVAIDDQSAQCATRICVQNHFQGRVSCPYGQAQGGGTCFAPGTADPVLVAVRPQLQERQAAIASICSCRCAADAPGPYCTCPDSMQCTHLSEDVGLGGQLAGSYCIPQGTEYAAQQSQTPCIEPQCGPAHP